MHVCINVIRHLITKVTLIPITLSAISSIYTIQAARYTNQHQLSEYLKVCSINIRISRTSKQSQHASSKFTTFLLENRFCKIYLYICLPSARTYFDHMGSSPLLLRAEHFGLCSAATAFDKGTIFIVSHLLLDVNSVFTISSDGPPV